MNKDNYVIKSAKAPFTEMDDTSGMLIGYANVYDIEDLQGDISQVGSFIKTVTENHRNIKIYRNHDINQFIGVPIELDANDNYGLRLTAKLNIENKNGKGLEAYNDAKFLNENGFESGFSIGGWVMKRSKANKKIVTEYKLNEISLLTTDPANQKSLVDTIKSVQQQDELTQEQFWNAITKAYNNHKFSDSIIKSLEEFLSLNEKDEPLESTIESIEPISLIKSLSDYYNLFI